MRFSKRELDDYRNTIDRYCLATGKTTYEIHEVYDWANGRDELSFTQEHIKKLHLTGLAEACRSHTISDEEGNRIRVRHCVEIVRSDDEQNPVQQTLWAHVDDAPYPFLVESLRQRHARVEADVTQLQKDLAYINLVLRRRGEREIQLTFDFVRPGSGLEETA